MPSASSPGMQARTGTRAHARPGARTRTHARERARTRGGLRVRPWGAHAPTRSLPDTSETLPRFREEQPEDARSTEKAKLPVTARGAPGSRSVLLASLTSGTQHAPTPDISPLAEQGAGRDSPAPFRFSSRVKAQLEPPHCCSPWMCLNLRVTQGNLLLYEHFTPTAFPAHTTHDTVAALSPRLHTLLAHPQVSWEQRPGVTHLRIPSAITTPSGL